MWNIQKGFVANSIFIIRSWLKKYVLGSCLRKTDIHMQNYSDRTTQTINMIDLILQLSNTIETEKTKQITEHVQVHTKHTRTPIKPLQVPRSDWSVRSAKIAGVPATSIHRISARTSCSFRGQPGNNRTSNSSSLSQLRTTASPPLFLFHTHTSYFTHLCLSLGWPNNSSISVCFLSWGLIAMSFFLFLCFIKRRIQG